MRESAEISIDIDWWSIPVKYQRTELITMKKWIILFWLREKIEAFDRMDKYQSLKKCI